MNVKENDTVEVHYKGTYDDGTVFDSSEGKDPLKFAAGTGQVIPGFDKAIIGMGIDNKKSISLEPSDAYGDYDEKMVFPMPLSQIGDDIKPEIDMQLKMVTQEGHAVIVVVKEITEDSLILDANHPMAGKRLNFDLHLINIEQE